MRLIDGDKLKEAFAVPSYEAFGVTAICSIIDDAPTVDVEPVRHGKWEITKDDYYCVAKCSLCHEEWSFDCMDDVELLNYNYCPNCGSFNGGSNETLHN